MQHELEAVGQTPAWKGLLMRLTSTMHLASVSKGSYKNLWAEVRNATRIMKCHAYTGVNSPVYGTWSGAERRNGNNT